MLPPPATQLKALLEDSERVTPLEELERKLHRSAATGEPLRVKLGIDPSAPDLHLGHAVVLRKLRQFQDFGHTAVLIIGDFTGRVGDPSGQSITRPMLSPQRLKSNATTYLQQAGKVLDIDALTIRWNSDWLGKLSFRRIIKLASTVTVAQILEREDFSERYNSGRHISLVEFLYPLMQGYDSVAIRADVEMGGSDQLFNLLIGRDLQKAERQEPQVAFTMPLLPGVGDERKMSKSLDNHFGLSYSPEEQFGRVMRIRDELMLTWFKLCTDLSSKEVNEIQRRLDDGTLPAVDAKRRLAREIVKLYQGPNAAVTAERRFDFRHVHRRIPRSGLKPQTVREAEIFGPEGLHVPSLLFALDLAQSKSEGKRLLSQAAVRARWVDWLDDRGERITAEWLPIVPQRLPGSVWSVGKRRFAMIGTLR